MKIKNNLIDLFAITCITVLILSSVFPKITLYGNNAMVCFLCEIVWFFLANIQSKETMALILKKYWFTLPYMIYVSLLPYVFGNGTIGNRYIYSFGLFFGLYMYQYYSIQNRMNVLSTAIMISIPFFGYTFFQTFIIALINPWAIRSIDNNTTVDLLNLGVGGYHFIYFLSLLFSAFFCYLINNNNNRILLTIVIVQLFSLIVISNFATALMICLIAIIISIFSKITKRPFLLICILLLFSILFFGDMAVEFKKMMSSIVSSEGRISNILNESNASFVQSFIDEFFRDRWPVNRISVNAFFNNPLFGIVIKDIVYTGFYVSFGQHSFVLDTFAIYGMGIGILTVINLLKVSDLYHDMGKNLKTVMTISLIVITILNNITHSVAFGFTLIVPTLLYMLRKKEHEKIHF